MRRRYRSKFGHGASPWFATLPDSLEPKPTVELKNERPGISSLVKIAHFKKSLSARMNGSGGDRGQCNSNAGYWCCYNAAGYRLIRTRHCGTNFAGQLSIRILNF
jgi:hypothetical protein